MRLLQSLGLFLLSCSAFAFESERPNTTGTTWEIYGVVLAVIVIGLLWVFFRQKREKEREERRRQQKAAGGS